MSYTAAIAIAVAMLGTFGGHIYGAEFYSDDLKDANERVYSHQRRAIGDVDRKSVV